MSILCILSLMWGPLVWVSAPPAGASQLTEITIPAPPGQIPDVWLGSVLNAKHAPPYPGPPRAKVILPQGYTPTKQYPLLILLAGASSDYRTWSDRELGRITTTAAGFPGIIVMPEGATGFYTDWWDGGKRGNPSWESYYLDTVIPEITKRYPIRPERRWHAIAGVSMGGLGAAYLGGRLPGFFGSVALISGVTNINLFPAMPNLAALIPQLNARQPFDLTAIYGPYEGYYAHGHNPVRLAANLRHTRVFMASGDGTPTSDGEPNGNSQASDYAAETALVRPSFDTYGSALRAADVGVTTRLHAGIHDFANFRRELRDAITWDMFAPVPESPTSWVNDTVATRGELWGLRYRFDTPPTQIVRLQRDANTLRVGGAGSAVTVTRNDGCAIHVATPATINLESAPCL